MDHLKITELRKWAKENELPDLWWYSIDGQVCESPVKIGQVPREGSVCVLNAQAQEQGQGDWYGFRYPGYQTPEEIALKTERERKRSEMTEKQRVALEFAGIPTEGLSKQQASEHLDRLFDSSSFDSEAYQDYKWSQRHRIYSEGEILSELFLRFQARERYVRENINTERANEAIVAAINEGVPEGQFLDFLRRRFPDFLLAESTRKRKLSEDRTIAESYRDFDRAQGGWSRSDNPKSKPHSGCLGMLVILALLTHSLLRLIRL